MWYELWDSETGNRVGKYPTEEAAFRSVLEDIRLYGPDSPVIVSLGLLQRDLDHGQDRLIAEGKALAARALALGEMDGANGMATRMKPTQSPRRS
jgi:hypothetical protein